MIRRQVWIATIFGLLAPALAQQSPKALVVIQVEDESGARVPKAQIEISTSEGRTVFCKLTNENGKAELDLPVGNFLFSVKSQGFCPQRGPLEVLDQQPQAITTKLRVDACPGPCEAACVAVIPSSPQLKLNVIVEDQTGARIPGAMVQVHAGDKRIAEVRADCSGEANLFLESGTYSILVRAIGFRTYSEVVDLANRAGLGVTAVLRIGDSGSGYPLNVVETLLPQRALPDNISIPYFPLATVTLPSHKVRRWLIPAA